MKYRHILGIDPGQISGFCLMKQDKPIYVSDIKLETYNSLIEFWSAHLERIQTFVSACKDSLIVVVEDFILNPRRANQFAGSRMETSKLIGIIEHFCGVRNIPLHLTKPVEHQSQFSDKVLLKLGYMVRTPRGFNTMEDLCLSNHSKDALRLAVHYQKCYNTKGE